MTLFEGLSLLVSATSTLCTVYIGLRQLRRSAPPVPVGPALPYRLPERGSGPAVPVPYVAPASRPGLVTVGCLLLYGAAPAKPVGFALYYAITYVTDPAEASQAIRDDGVVDVLGMGGIALVCALLAVFIGRRSRVARVIVWTLGGLSVALLAAMDLGVLGLLLNPEAPSLSGLDLFAFGYVFLVLGALVSSATLLLPTASRTYFRRT